MYLGILYLLIHEVNFKKNGFSQITLTFLDNELDSLSRRRIAEARQAGWRVGTRGGSGIAIFSYSSGRLGHADRS